MQLTPLQLQIQQRADKTLSFGCIIGYDNVYKRYIRTDDGGHHTCVDFDGVIGGFLGFTDDLIIGHPMNYGYLLYIMGTNLQDIIDKGHLFELTMIDRYAKEHMIVRKQTVIERPVELQKLVLQFLLILSTDN